MVATIHLLDGPLAALRESQIDLLTDVAKTLAEMGDEAKEDRKRLSDIAKDLSEMFFLVVIIGEFNAGKSTFVNALIGEALLPIGITPTTETIELIRYSQEANRKPIMHEDSLREWSHPNTGAPGVAFVDTPGTGSVFQRHETTAKDFLHRSDLVIFLLSAKRAFAETERIYLEMARNYGKKIILVVNQIDLLQPEEQSKVKRFIQDQVKEHLGLQPLLFMVSAKQSLEAQQASNPDETSGMDAVRAHLRGVFAEAPPAKQKLLAQLNSAKTIVEQYHTTIRDKAELVQVDTAKVKEVQTELEQQSIGLSGQLTEARLEVDKVFEGMKNRGLNFIDTNLSIRKLAGSGNREKLQAEFQDVVIGRAVRDINEATNGYINVVVDQSRVYWRSVIERLNQLRDLLEQEVAGLDSNIYAEQRESLEEAIRIAETELKVYSTGKIVDEIQHEFQASMSGFRASALLGIGGAIGAIWALAAPGAIFGIGGVASIPAVSAAFAIAAPVAALGGLAAMRYYLRITNNLKQDFAGRVDKLMERYHDALDDLTRKERNRLAHYGTQVLTPIFSRLDVLAKRYAEQKTKFDTYAERMETLHKGIEESQ